MQQSPPLCTILTLLLVSGPFLCQALSADEPKADEPKTVVRQPAAHAHKKLLVISPEHFHKTLHEYIEHKRKLLPTELVSLEAVLRDTAGHDDPERVKRFLYAQWKQHDAGYVLLVGDADVFPVRYMVLDRVTPAAFDYAFYPSDLYYSDLARHDGSFDDWNAHKDGFHAGYFGEVRGEKNKSDLVNFDHVDYRPDWGSNCFAADQTARSPTSAATR